LKLEKAKLNVVIEIMTKLLLLFGLTAFVLVGFGQKSTILTPVNDMETKEYLFGKAVRLSGITEYTLADMPPIYLVSKKDLNKEVCPEDPENCRNLAAVFDDIRYRILALNDLEISSNFKPFNYSFVIHELIHALQYRSRGAEIFNGCDSVYNTELEAYTAQDLYLKEEGEFFRASIALKYFYCDETVAKADYLKSNAAWIERTESGKWKR
jgi:hypothetical protein